MHDEQMFNYFTAGKRKEKREKKKKLWHLNIDKQALQIYNIPCTYVRSKQTYT